MKLTDKLVATTSDVYDGANKIGQIDTYPNLGASIARFGEDKIGTFPSFDEALDAIQRVYRRSQITYQKESVFWGVYFLNKRIGWVKEIIDLETQNKYVALLLTQEPIGVYMNREEAITAVMENYDENFNHSDTCDSPNKDG